MIISVIDYGLSNLRSVCSAISHLGSVPELISSPEDIRKADALILPGVGAFSDGMEGCARTVSTSPSGKKPCPVLRSWAYAWVCRCCLTLQMSSGSTPVSV